MISVFDHPWQAGLFGDPEGHAPWAPDRQVAHMVAFEVALAQAAERVGLVAPGVGQSAAQALERFSPDPETLALGMARDGVPVPDLVAQMRRAVGPGAAEAVHLGATSQDVMDTALALTLSEVSALVVTRLKALGVALEQLTDRFGSNALMGRTRMQAAMPLTVADRITPWRSAVVGHRSRIDGLRADVAVLQLGGAVGTNAALGDQAAEMAELTADALGLGVAPAVWHADRGNVVAFGDGLALITGTLGKIGQDIALMAQQGIDEVVLSGGGGSSAMPHKSNPVRAELLVTLARYSAGQAGLLHQAMVHEQERSGTAWALEWMVLPQIAASCTTGLAAAQTLIAQIEQMGMQA